MAFHGMASSILQRNNRHLVEVVFRQFHSAVENSDQVFALQLLRLGVGSMTLQAQRIGFADPKQMLVIVAVRIMADRAALFEGRLVGVQLLALFGLVAVTGQANRNRVGLGESRRAAGVRVMAVGAIARRPRMLDFRLLDLLSLVGVAGDADLFGARLSQDNLAVLGGLVTGIARLRFKRTVHERLHQFGRSRLVRIVAGEAIGLFERLPLVCLHQLGVLYIVTIEAQCGSVLGQVVIEFTLAAFARLVRNVARVATHVERGVTAATRWNIRSLSVTGEAKIVFLFPSGCFQELEFVVGTMWIVAGQAIANSWRVDASLDLRGILVVVTGEAELVRSRGDELYAGGVLVDPDFMATQTSHRNGRVDGLAFSLVLVTLEAFGRVRFRVQGDGMHRAQELQSAEQRQTQHKEDLQQQTLYRTLYCGTCTHSNLRLQIPN